MQDLLGEDFSTDPKEQSCLQPCPACVCCVLWFEHVFVHPLGPDSDYSVHPVLCLWVVSIYSLSFVLCISGAQAAGPEEFPIGAFIYSLTKLQRLFFLNQYSFRNKIFPKTRVRKYNNVLISEWIKEQSGGEKIRIILRSFGGNFLVFNFS